MRRPLAALFLMMALGATALTVAAPVAAATEPTFGAATATSTFLQSIDVEQTATLPAGIERVEALVRTGRHPRTFVATIPTPPPGATTLRYRYETPSGSLYPNTMVQLGFRVTLGDGTIVSGPTTTIRYEDTRFDWKTLQGDHVLVHWVEGDSGFGQRIVRIADQAIKDASELLGVEETEPIDFFVYADRTSFYDVLGPALQENIGGIALPEIRTLFANIPPSSVTDPWVGIVVPHELTHLVFDTATHNPYHSPAHWLDEGLADYLAKGYDASARASVQRAVRADAIMPLHALIGQFPSPPDLFSLAYDESVSAIDYLIRTHGQDALVKLIRSYAGGVSDDAAFSAALGVDAAGFEAAWLDDLGVKPPPPYGPQPAPAGPLPPGWNAPAPGSSVAPIPSRVPAAAGSSADLSGPIILIVAILAVVTLVAGIFLTATRLNRGDPLLPEPANPLPPEPADPDSADPDRQ